MLNIKFAEYDDYNCILTIDSTITENQWKNWIDNLQVILGFNDETFLGWLEYNIRLSIVFMFLKNIKIKVSVQLC